MNLLCSRFQLKTSLGLGVVFLFIHGGAIFCVYFTFIFWAVKIALIFFSLISLIIIIKTYVFRNVTYAIIEFGPNVGVDSSWYLKKYSGDVVIGFINYPVFVSNHLIIVNFVLVDKRLKISVPISRDSLTIEEFRKLKVFLRTGL
ncbi:MAG TPA: hypothetical protein DEG23_03615 [Coxiellaceae bacterium]|nr:hypothetical protein [Coxiellaceae bacterium]